MSWLARLRAPVYANTGSVARDHLASERTFLAWLRTGLGFVALGIAIERVSQLDLQELVDVLKDRAAGSSSVSQARSSHEHEHTGMLVGSMLGTGAGCIVYGTTRYFSNLRALEKGTFKPAYYGAGGLGFTVAAVATAVYTKSLMDRRPSLASQEGPQSVHRR